MCKITCVMTLLLWQTVYYRVNLVFYKNHCVTQFLPGNIYKQTDEEFDAASTMIDLLEVICAFFLV